MFYTANRRLNTKNLRFRDYEKAMRSGKYINQLSGDLQYKAFIPNFFPFEIKSDDELQNLPKSTI